MKKIGLFIAALGAVGLACSGQVEHPNSAAALVSTGTAQEGVKIYRQYCVLCHGADGKLALNGAKDLTKSALTKAERVQLITKGKGLMTPFGEMLSTAEIEAVAEYTMTLK